MKNPASAPTRSILFTSAARRANAGCFVRFARRVLCCVALAALFTAPSARAQLLDCSCLSTQAVLFTNACCGFVPNLCPVATNCYRPSTNPAPGYTCSQLPVAGTFVCSNTPVSFTLTENITGLTTNCGVTFFLGASAGTPFTLLCPSNQTVLCNSTSWLTNSPGWTNTCCTNVLVSLVNITTNWPTVTMSWNGQACGLVSFCSQTISFATSNGLACNCLDIVCPSNIVVQSCLPTNTAGLAGTNIFYPLPFVTNYCIGVITNLVCTPPPGSPFPVGTNTVGCTVYDNLGNSATCTFDIIVLGDTTPPNVICAGNQTYQCNTTWLPIRPIAFDACCGTNVFVTLMNVTTNLLGPCTQVYTFVWDVMDCNGNHTNCSDVVTVVDTTPPVINCISNQSYQCGVSSAGTPGGWTPVPPTAFDACCGTNVTVTLVSATTNGANQCNQTITLNWRAVDCCTNAAFCTEVVTITDTNPPIVNCAGPKLEQCGSGWTFNTPTAFDVCCGTNVTITVLSNVTVFSSQCFSIYDRFWRITDCCTNAVLCSQRVTEVDTKPPVLTCASNKTVQCSTLWTFDPPSAYDLCCPTSSITISIVSTVTNSAPACPIIVTRTWMATDCCTNSSFCSQTVTVVDTVPPVVNCAPNQTVQCGSAWSFAPPTAFDVCCGTNVSITLLNTVTNGSVPCAETITAIWDAMDCCGNHAACTNFVTVLDTTPPVINCRSNYTEKCGNPLFPPTAVDNCCPAVTVSLLNTFTNVSGICSQVITFTWQAVDCCTNSAICTEVVTIIDTNPPVIICAANKIVDCTNTTWTFDNPTALDTCCGTNVSIIILGTVTNTTASSCSNSYTRTWRATDCCSNAAVCSQTVSVVDTTPPVIVCGPNQTVQCGSIWTWGPTPTATDACCGANVTVTLFSTGVTNLSPCVRVFSQTWRATDCCSNTAFCTRTTTEIDTVPPTITCASGFTTNFGSAWTFTTPTAFDACCLAGINIINTTTNVDGVNCRIRYRRTWRAVDCCGNLSPPCSQTVFGNITSVPPNDLCPNAITLALNGAYICGSNLCATPTPAAQFNPTPPTWLPCGSSLNSRDVWYKVVAACTGPMTVDVCPPCGGFPVFDTVLSAYTNNCSQLTQVSASACNDDSCGTSGLQSLITFPAVAGKTYLIRVGGFGGLASAGWFAIRATQSFISPPNDLCSNAIPLGLGSTCGTTICATPSATNTIPTPCGNSQNAPDVWYAFTPTCSGTITITTCGNCTNTITPFNTVLSAYSGSCGTLAPVACNDNAPFFVCPPQSRIVFAGTAGVTYYIRVAGNTLASGNFQLNISQTFTPPVNDLCANAIATFPATYAWNNCGANTDGPTTGTCVPRQDVWFSYTPSCSGTVSVSTCNSALNTALAIYTGCPGTGLITCNDDAPPGVGPCGGTAQSYVTFAATAGVTYYIRVGSSLPGVVGSGLLTINGPNPPAQFCPTGTGTPLCRWFQVMGNPNCVPWAWTITAACCANITNLNVPAVCAGNTNTLAVAFVNSINAACGGVGLTATAFTNLPVQGIFRICVNCPTITPWHLAVGPAGTPPANQCVVPTITMLTPLPVTGGPCNFNPGIVELPRTGSDANANGVDDGIDIMLGTSADVNGNLIPDETEACIAPELSLNPEAQSVQAGDSVLLAAAASGTAPFTYRWSRNGLPLSNGGNISGATSGALSVSPVGLADVGAYTVAISNACGGTVTAPVDLTLVPLTLPVLYDVNASAGSFSFTVETKTGYDYVVEFKNNLNDPAWTPLVTVPGSGGPELIFDSAPLPQMRFYRVRQQPGP